MDKQLRLIAGQIVVESKLSSPAKMQLINFIKEQATDTQVKALLLDGKVVKLDEEAEQIVNERFEVSEAGGRVAKLRKSHMSQVGAGGGLNPFWVAYRAVRSRFSQCNKKCGTYELNTSRRQHCVVMCKVQKAQGELAAAQKSKDNAKIAKAKHGLAKAQALANKSKASFTKRGADV